MVGKESQRYSEARYYLGLSRFHQGDRTDAQKLWSGMIENCAEDPWVYRADWAWSTIQQRTSNGGKRQTSFAVSGKGNSPLGRIGYMGPENPDLSPRGE